MAAVPPYSTLYSTSGILSAHSGSKDLSASSLAIDNAPRHLSAMVCEIERVRSRFANEKSNSDQFSQQLRMLSQQIDSLATQQSTMLEFHIGRMDSMLTDLKASEDATREHQQKALEAQQRVRLQKEQHEREVRDREERERRAKIEREQQERRDTLEREERKQREKLEKEQRERREALEREEREEKEMRLRRGQEDRERKGREDREEEQQKERRRSEVLARSSLPSLNVSDIIPPPSRTVAASKRKLSLDLPRSTRSSHAAEESATNANKRVKLNNSFTPASDTEDGGNVAGNVDFKSMFAQFMSKDQDKKNDTMGDDEKTSSMEDSDLAPMDLGIPEVDMSGVPNADQVATDLPSDIQEVLKQQAMAMLQAQLAAGNSLPGIDGSLANVPQDTHQGAIVKPEPSALPPNPPAASHISASGSLATKTEQQPPVSASVAKPEPTPPPAEKKAKKAPPSKKSKKEVVPAVEDTTIADPMSVPLKNKAIHEWMSKDPERLYTADDICKAGIRYRARTGIKARNVHSGRVYILDAMDLSNLQKVLGGKSKNILWRKAGRNQWKVI